MGQMVKFIKTLVETQEKLDEYRPLKNKALSIFENPHLSLSQMDEIINNEWVQINSIIGLSHFDDPDIFTTFLKLKNADINRKEFRSAMESTIAKVNKYEDDLEEELLNEKSDLSKEWINYLEKSDVANSKYVQFVLEQNEVKEFLMKFLER